MIQDQNRLHFLFRRYADNTCSREEMKELFAIFASARENGSFIPHLHEVWNSIYPSESLDSIDQNALFREISQKTYGSPVRTMMLRWTKVAAILLILLGAVVFYFSLKPGEPTTTVHAEFENSKVTKLAHQLLLLPDGSTVLLNNNSSLDFPQQFTGDTREVILKGEAYFDIKPDASRPFIIHTGKVKTRVLGTAFNIRAYPEEIDVTVTVTKGTVKVELEDQTLGIISPNEQISFNKSKNMAIQQQVIADTVLAWKGKDLVFDNITFKEAAEIIGKRYGVSIHFENENLKNCRFHASFLNETGIEQVLTVLCDLNKAAYSIKGNAVTIEGEGCSGT